MKLAEQDKSRLAEILPQVLSNDFFAELDPEVLSEIEAELELVELPKGTLLFDAGDPGEAMYFVARGMLEVAIPQPEGNSLRLDVLEPGSTAGEIALLTGQPRTAAVSAMVESEVIQLSKIGFDRLAQKYPDVMQKFSFEILPRIQRIQLAAVLTQLFGPLETQVVHAIQRNITWRHLPSGEVLMRKGDPGDAMYIVINGRLRIVDDSIPGMQRVLGDVVRGETVGEFALLTGEPRTATVYAVRDTDLACFSRAYMDELTESFPKMMLQMLRSIARRSQAQLNLKTSTVPTVVLALVPATPGLLLTQFIDQLSAQLTADGKTLCLDSQRFDEQFGRPGSAQLPPEHPTSALVNNWLTGTEQTNRFVIYVADLTLTEWTWRCMRQADRLALVAGADSYDDVNSELVEAALHSLSTRGAPDLVLIQPEDRVRPVHTSRWLSRLKPQTLNHVRMGMRQDFGRLARRLTGRAVGLVLSGGGARGFAHVGAIRALEEAGQEIDLIGGTSMGALIGAAYALDSNAARMLEMVRTFSSPNKLLDYTLPYASLVASFKVTRLLKEIFGEVQIEDLWKSYFCLSTNLSRAEPVIHHIGSLWEAVRASIAIPGIFAPLLREGDVLVDGGVMNNFPVDEMRKRSDGGFIIGINTSPKKQKAYAYRFGPGISGWQVLWSKINPFAPKIHVPSILSNLMRATEASSAYRNSFAQTEADLLIMPPVGDYGSLDFGDYEKIIEQGYLEARDRIAALAGEK